jgi:hypothetical protein
VLLSRSASLSSRELDFFQAVACRSCLEEGREEGRALSRVGDVHREPVFQGCHFFFSALEAIIISYPSQEVLTLVLVSFHIYQLLASLPRMYDNEYVGRFTVFLLLRAQRVCSIPHPPKKSRSHGNRKGSIPHCIIALAKLMKTGRLMA